MPTNTNHDELTPIKGWSIDGRYWVRDSDGLRIPIIQGGGKAVAVMRAPWAFGDDDGSESGHTLDTEGVDRDTAGSGTQAADTPFLIRLAIAETGGGTQNVGYALFADKNSGGTFTEVTTTRTDGLRIANDTQSRSDDESTTERLTAGGGTFVAGKFDDGQTQQGTTAFSMDTQYSEVEFCIEIDSANAASADVWELRVEEADGTDLATYPSTLPFVEAASITPTLAVADIAHANALDAAVLTGHQGEIFTLDFEEGTLGDFDSTTDPDSDISVNSGSPLVGSYDTQWAIDDTTLFYGKKDLPNALTQFRCRFYFDGNSYGTASTQEVFSIISIDLNNGPPWNFIYLQALQLADDSYRLRLYLVDDNNTAVVNFVNIAALSDGPHWIEFLVNRAATASSLDGTIEIWIDDVSVYTKTDLDVYTNLENLNDLIAGIWTAPTASLAGNATFYIDDIVFRDDDTLIGEAAAGTPALVVADISHANALDPVVLTSHQVIGTANDIAHANALDPVVLVSHQVIGTVADIAHANALDGGLTLSSSTPISVADISHGNALDPVILLSGASLPVADIDHSQALDPVVLLSGNALTVNDLLHDNTLDAVILSSAVDLTVAEIDHAQSLDQASPLVTHNALTTNDISHSNTLDGVTTTSHNSLTVADIDHSQELDATVLVFHAAGSLVTQEINHAHSLDEPTLSFDPASELLVMQEISHDHLLDAAILTSNNAITIADISHAHELDEPVVTFIPLLVMDDVSHGHGLDSPVVTHIPPPVSLTVEDCLHTHVVDGLRFGGVVVSFMHDHDDFFIFMI